MVFSLLPLSAFAATTASGTCGENVTWSLDNSGTLTISGTGKMDDYGWNKVSPWYNKNTTIKSIVIRSGVTSIGSEAFEYCSELLSISIPNSVTTIGSHAFDRCERLKSITIPDGVSSIGSYAFLYCSSLISVNIPNSVTSIGEGAFHSCSKLTSVAIPDSVTNIGIYAFIGCDSLSTIAVDKDNADYSSISGVLFDKNLTRLVAYPAGKSESSYTVPASTSSIGCHAFGSVTNLENVMLTNSVTSIEDGAFYDCSNLTNVTIPNSVTSIGEGAFAYCHRLKSVAIPDSVTNISSDVFSYCIGLTSVTIPNSVTIIGKDAFNGCRSLTSVTIPNSVTSIENYAFSGCKSLKSVAIGTGVKSLGKYAFKECTSLKSMTIPGNVTSIRDHVFEGCSNLGSISVDKGNATYSSDDGVLFNKTKSTIVIYPMGRASTSYSIPNGVKSISSYAFKDCSRLTSITIPASVTNIGEYAFYGCTSMISVGIPNSVTGIGNAAFYDCTSLKNVAIPDNVTSIGNFAFWNCSSLTSVKIGNGVKNIGDYAFCYCTSLTSVTIPSGATEISEGTFADCRSLTSITIPDGVTNIGESAFSDCIKLKHVAIPDSVTNIGRWAFRSCSSLTSITFPNGITNIGDCAFFWCSGLTSVTIPCSVKSIGNEAFSSCKKLKSIAIPDSVTKMGDGVFKDCSTLQTVELPSGISKIPEYTFSNCAMLKSVSIPASVKTVGKFAFEGANISLKVRYGGLLHQWKQITIESGNDLLKNAAIEYSALSRNGIMQNACKAEVNARTVTPQSKGQALAGVTASYNGKTTNNSEKDASFKFPESGDLKKLTLSKNGYRDYEIPAEVMNSIKLGYGFDAYMVKDTKDGKPYISSVFGKSTNTTEYSDILNSNLVVRQGGKYDIIATAKAVKGSATYVIEQDPQHRIESSTGVFSAADLYSKLEPYKDVYIYVRDTQGKTGNPEKLSVSVFKDEKPLERILNTSTYSLGGSGGVSIKVPDGNPIFGNSSFSLSAFSAPFTVYYDATNDTFIGTVGWDLYEYEKEDKTVFKSTGKYTTIGDGECKRFLETFKEEFKWFNNEVFTDGKKKKDGKSVKDSWNAFIKKCNKASGQKYSKGFKSKDFTTDILGYIEFQVTEQGLILKESSLKIGANLNYSYTYQGSVWVIPAYFKTTLGCSGALEGSAKRTIASNIMPFEFEITLDIEPKLSLEAGIGVEKLAKSGVEAKGTVPIKVEFEKQHFRLDFSGQINIKTKAFIFSWDKTLVEGTANIVDTYWGSTKKSAPARLYSNGANPATQDSGKESFVSRSYLSNTSAWLGGKSTPVVMRAKSVSADSVSVNVLQKSVFESGKPVITTVGDKVLMAWIQDDASRDEYNRMRLVYSVYDGVNWSEPKAVYDDGKNDDAPAIVSDGNTVYFAWQKITDTLDANATAAKALQSVDIYTAQYDLASDSVSNVKRISTDGYDYAQTITVADNAPVVYFANCVDESMAISLNNKIYKVSGESKTEIVDATAYVQSIAADGQSVSYASDTDNDLNTYEDTNVKSYQNGSFAAFDKANVNSAMTSAYYGRLNGQTTLFVSDGSNIYYRLDGEMNTVFADSHGISNLTVLNNDGDSMFVWSELLDGIETVYGVKYADGVWSEPFVITECEGFWVDHLSVANYNGKIAGVFMQDIPDTSSELTKITQANLAFMTAADYYDIALGCLSADEESIVQGERAEVSVYVSNNSSKSVNEVEFTLSDSLGADQTQTVDVNLKAGEAKSVTLTYSVPENFEQTTLGVSAQILGQTEKDTDNNSSSLKIGVADLRITQYDVAKCDDNYIVTAYVKNNSQTPSGEVLGNLYLNSEDDLAVANSIDSIASDEVGMVQFGIPESTLQFDENNIARVYVDFTDDQSKYGSTAKECILITKSETVCAHPMTEKVEAVAATCTADGNTSGTKCLGCGEIISGCETISALGHNYQNGSCTRCGAKNPNYVAAPVLKATSSAGKPKLTWNKVDGATKYYIYRSTDGKNYKQYTSTTKTSYTNTSTTIGTTYYYKVKAAKVVNGKNVYSVYSNVKSVKCVPAAPVLKATTSAGKPKLTWNKVDGATKYYIYRSTDGKKFSLLATTTGTSITNTKAKIGTTYYYKVKAVDASGAMSEFSNDVNIKCRPAAPVVSISRSNGKPKLTWKAVTGASKYYIYRSTDGKTFKYYEKTTKTSFTDSKAASGKKYYYKVKAVTVVNGKAIVSGYSNVKSIFTSLAKPTVKITTSNGKPKLSWSKVTGADKYYVYRSTDGKTFKHFATTTKLSYTNTSAKKGTKYYYKVKAVYTANTNANSAYSAVVSIKATK